MIGSISKIACFYTKGIANTCSHLFDLLRYFFGNAQWVWAYDNALTTDKDPTMDIYLAFPKGIQASVLGCQNIDYRIFEIDILGTHGRIKIHNGFTMELFLSGPSPRTSEFKELLAQPAPLSDGRKGYFLNAIEDIVSCIEHKRTPLCSGEDGRDALEIICAAHESVKQGSRKIAIPLADRTIRIESK